MRLQTSSPSISGSIRSRMIEIGMLGFDLPESFRAGHRGDGTKPFLFEVEFDELENIVLIFDDQNFFVVRCGA